MLKNEETNLWTGLLVGLSRLPRMFSTMNFLSQVVSLDERKG